MSMTSDPPPETPQHTHVPRWTAGVLLAMLGLGFVMHTAWALWSSYHDRLHAAESKVSFGAMILEENVSRAFGETDWLLTSLADQCPSDQPWNANAERALHNRLATAEGLLPQINSIVVVSAAGRVLAETKLVPTDGRDVSDRTYFRYHRDAGGRADAYVGTPILSRLNGQEIIPMSRTILGRDGTFCGVVSAAFDPTYFTDLYRQFTATGDAIVSLWRNDGTLLLRSPPVSRSNDLPPHLPSPPGTAVSGIEDMHSPVDGVARIVGYRRSARYAMVLRYGLDVAAIHRRWLNDSLGQILPQALLFLLLLGFGTYVTLARRNTLHLTETLRLSEEQFHAAFDQSFTLACLLDGRGEPLRLNQAARAFFDHQRRPPRAVLQLASPWATLEPGWFDKILRQTVGGTVRREATLLDLAGRPATLDLIFSPVRVGTTAQILLTGLDITERKKTQTERERLIGELKRSRADLMRFSEIAAHHLQEPSRRLAVFAQRLAAALPKPLAEDARLCLEFIREDARGLTILLRDVQLYLAADQPRGPMALTDPGPILERLRSWLARTWPGTPFTLEISVLPPAWLDELRLRDIFEALLENALLNRVPGRSCRIAVAGERRDNQVVYTVADNGCGIAPQYWQRIFGVFERLTPRSAASPGTGIGLAVVRKIAESTGGGARVKDSSADGTTFEIVLMATEPCS